jgi:hypothetical protein
MLAWIKGFKVRREVHLEITSWEQSVYPEEKVKQVVLDRIHEQLHSEVIRQVQLDSEAISLMAKKIVSEMDIQSIIKKELEEKAQRMVAGFMWSGPQLGDQAYIQLNANNRQRIY